MTSNNFTCFRSDWRWYKLILVFRHFWVCLANFGLLALCACIPLCRRTLTAKYFGYSVGYLLWNEQWYTDRPVRLWTRCESKFQSLCLTIIARGCVWKKPKTSSTLSNKSDSAIRNLSFSGVVTAVGSSGTPASRSLAYGLSYANVPTRTSSPYSFLCPLFLWGGSGGSSLWRTWNTSRSSEISDNSAGSTPRRDQARSETTSPAPWSTSGSLCRGFDQQDLPRQSFVGDSGHMTYLT